MLDKVHACSFMGSRDLTDPLYVNAEDGFNDACASCGRNGYLIAGPLSRNGPFGIVREYTCARCSARWQVRVELWEDRIVFRAVN